MAGAAEGACDAVRMSGCLDMKNGVLGSWAGRWAVLDGSRLALFRFFESEEAGSSPTLSLELGTTMQKARASGATDAAAEEFELVTDERTIRLRASTVGERDEWLAAFARVWLAAWCAGPGAAADAHAALGAFVRVAPTAAELETTSAKTLVELMGNPDPVHDNIPGEWPRLLSLLIYLPSPRLAALCAEVDVPGLEHTRGTLLSLACIAQAPASVLARLLAAGPAAAAKPNDKGHYPLHALLNPRRNAGVAAVRNDLAAPALAALARAMVAAHPAAAATAVVVQLNPLDQPC